jgi:membrane complex biogenesis BtpA family protein
MILVENMHDFPPLREADMGPEVPAAMTALARAVREAAPAEVPVGVQVLFAAHRVALAVAVAAELGFVRAEAWTYGHLADKGWAEASAATSVRYAEQIGASNVAIWADVKKKHASHAITADLETEEIVGTLALHGAQAAIITGTTTGVAPDPDDFRRARARTDLPLVLGSGLTVQNAPHYASLADAFIVGTSIKEEGDWRNPVDPERAKALVGTIRDLC